MNFLISSSILIFTLNWLYVQGIENDLDNKINVCNVLPKLKNGRVTLKVVQLRSFARFQCEKGYKLIGKEWQQCNNNGEWPKHNPKCTDVDECTVNSKACSINADCVNLSGSYACVCKPGYYGNGKTCDISNENFLKWSDTCGSVSSNRLNSSMRHRRIVGGRQAEPGEWPWQALIHLRKRASRIPFVGGALIDKKWVVTLASVMYDGFKRLTPSDVTVTLGDHDRRKNEFTEQQFRVRRIFINPDFDRVTLNKDIALLELERPVKLGGVINKVCLVSGRKAKAFEKSSSIATVTGWGTTKPVRIGGKPGGFSNILQEANLPLVSSSKCQRATAYSFSPRYQICAGYYTAKQSPCYGDAGSPLVTQDPDSGRWALIGLYSWSEGCSQTDTFSYYTRVAKFRRWILHVTRNS